MTHQEFPSRLRLIVGAVLLTCGPAVALADDNAVAELAKPDSTISMGAGQVTGAAPRFGQYTGLRQEGTVILMDADIVKRDDATGTWLKLQAKNLGLESREFRFEHNRQGNWKYFVEYDQTPRFEPHSINTGLRGVGSAVQTVNGGGGTGLEIKTRRDAIGLGFEKILAGGFEIQVKFKNEEKDGARLFGQGDSPGAPTTRFLTEPVNTTTRQLDATAAYNGDKLQVTGGYYGTSFDNHTSGLNVVGGIAGFTPMALPPGNQSHQLYLAGGYTITPTTRSTFKVAYSHQTQNEDYIQPTAAGVNRTNLGGRLDTTQAQFGITSRPTRKVTLLADFRFEDRKDKTPVLNYFTGVTGTSTLDGRNEPRSIRTTNGKAEASYQLPMGFRVTGGADVEVKERNTFRVRSVSHRDRTEETSYRADVRRTLGEGVTGSLGYVRSKRDGSDFLQTVVVSGAAGSNLVAPLHLANRDRDKVRMTVNWMPTEQLSFQLMMDQARDHYDPRTAQGIGPLEGTGKNYSLDASYSISEEWQVTGFTSRNKTTAVQSSVSGSTWGADIANVSDTFGVGLRGQPLSRLKVGADFTYTNISDEVRQFILAGAGAAGRLPDISTKMRNIKMFADYAMQKNMGFRLNYIYDRWSSDDWTWTSYVYTDGTRVIQNPSQKTQFIGLSAYYRFQ
jgi:MtrB/PioB family decaheme-associated outer membrane protein